jgi:hypothetical protein
MTKTSAMEVGVTFNLEQVITYPFVNKEIGLVLASISISNLFKYWSSDLLITTLKDKSIRRVHLSENGSKVLYDERIYIGERIRDIESLDAGFILSTDNGSLIYIAASTIMGEGVFPLRN